MSSPKCPYTVDSRESNAAYDELDETTPLLPPPSYTPHDDSTPLSSPGGWHVSQRLVWTILLAVLLVSFGDQLLESPQTRIFESIICYRYYERTDPSKILIGREAIGPGAIGGVEEMYCKTGAVQNDLAALRGWQFLFDGIPTLLLALPVGWAADRFGRKPIVLLGILAFVLRNSFIQFVTWFWQAFDVRVSWASTIFASIGGGNAATSSIFYVLLSDISTDTTRAEAFVRVGAFNLLAGVVMPPLAALLMEVNPWIPNLVGTLLQLLTLVCFFFVPETIHLRQGLTPSSPLQPTDDTQPLDIPIAPPAQSLWHSWKTKCRESTSFILKDWRILALIAPFSFHILSLTVGQLLLQYISSRYGIKMSKAIILTTIRNGIVAVLFFLILPYVSKLLVGERFRFSAQRRDLYLSRVSLILLAAGWLLTGLAPNIPVVVISFAISSLGYGMGPLLRSSLTFLIEKQHIARVYAVVSVVDTLGVMGGSPAMARLFRLGFELGGFWLGMPFYFLALLAACFAVLIFAVRLRKGEDLDIRIEED